MDPKPVRIVQISDIHLYKDKNKELLGVKTHESFAAVLHLLKNATAVPDMVILTGDLSQDYSEQSYLIIADLIKEFHFPIYYIPGNHDDSNTMSRVYPRDNLVADKQIFVKQ